MSPHHKNLRNKIIAHYRVMKLLEGLRGLLIEIKDHLK